MREAHLTLIRAASFVRQSHSMFAHPGHGGEMQRLRGRVIGNHLRELDRFLCVLVDAAGARRGGNAASRRDATVKLAMSAAGLGEYPKQALRLKALRRSFNCLVFTSGLVTRGDERGARIMSVGWWCDPRQTALQSVAVGEHLDVSAADLLDAAEFYVQLGDIVAGLASAGTRRHAAGGSSRRTTAHMVANAHR